MSDMMQKMTQEEDWKRELGHVFFARRRLILTTASAVMAGAVLIALFWPSTYAAKSSVLLLGKQTRGSSVVLDPMTLREPQISSKDVISELEIVRSPELARRTVRRLREKDGWDEARLDKNLAKAARAFLGRLNAVGVADSSAIRIAFSGPTPEEAELGLDTLLDEYIQYRADVFNPAGQDKFFEERMEHYRQERDALAAQIASDEGEMNPVFIDQLIKGNLGRLALLQSQRSELEMELAVSDYLDNEALQARIEIVKKAITQLQKETNEIQAKWLAADSAYQQVKLVSQSLEMFAKRAEEVKINNTIARSQLAGDISVLNRAAGTAALVFPRRGATLFLGLVAALITGLSVGFLAEFFDHTVRRPEDVQRNTGLPVLCSFPTLGEEAASAPSECVLGRVKKGLAGRHASKDAG